MALVYLYHIHRNEDKSDLCKGYIGISKNPELRFKQHLKKPNKILKNALSKYSDITMTVITEGSLEEMLRMEEVLRPDVNLGWNLAKGGGLPPVTEMTEGRKEKISKKMKGRQNSLGYKHLDSTKKLISLVNSGKVVSNETKELIRKSRVGEKASTETRSRMSESQFKRFSLESEKEKLKKSHTGKKLSCEHKSKISEGMKGHIVSENTKGKLREINKNAPRFVCPHCGKKGGKGAMIRWHFDNCKLKGVSNVS